MSDFISEKRKNDFSNLAFIRILLSAFPATEQTPPKVHRDSILECG